MSVLEALEMAHCAQINLGNLGKLVPMLKGHPFFAIVAEQIRMVVEELEKAEGEED